MSLVLLVVPAVTALRLLLDDALRGHDIAPTVLDWHAALARRIGPWARERVASARATQLDVRDVSGTEWPMFGAVFYLWASEAVQAKWERDGSRGISPARRDAESLAAVAALVADPGHADWVRRHWGDAYLERNNLFYRMLLVAGLDSYERLSGDITHHRLLAAQVRSLAAEFDASPHGLLEDYPGETYGVDVYVAYAALARARERLGMVDDGWLARGARAFDASTHDSDVALPAYFLTDGGVPLGPARGVGLSMMLAWSPTTWPAMGEAWYARYVELFWQERGGFAGFREFARGSAWPDWMLEVDAGPVFAGYGTAASAFGLAAARTHGDMDRAYALTSEALLAALPMPDGTLLVPRLLSNAVDAPYTGEAALLFALTRTPAGQVAPATRATPVGVWVAIALMLAVGIGDPAWRVVRLLRAGRTGRGIA
ncbi:MAG TPA: hypothetical protein VFL14_07300 [Xanthomonadales bacterium]|nr:hypothetical protein [Xanthomonadales bacterium]